MRLPSIPKGISLTPVSTSRQKSSRLTGAIATYGLVLLLFLCSCVAGVTQQPSEQPTTSQIATVNGLSDDARYRIGPGDVLEVRVMKAPELSVESLRVDQRGMIRMPMLEGDIKAACLTETELAQKIATLYLEYKRNPNVDVFVKEFQSQTVAVIGAINNLRTEGTQFRLHRRVRLLELLTLAGGLSDHAGRTVNIVHTSVSSVCDSDGPQASEGDLATLVSFKLSDTLRGVPEANPILHPGDVVVVPEGEQVYVVGNVWRPSTVPLREPLTVSRAIAIAGGLAPNTKKTRVRIVRQTLGRTEKQEIYVDLTAVEKRKAEDPILLPNDIVDVPISGTKSFLRTLMGAVAPAVSQMPVRIIP